MCLFHSAFERLQINLMHSTFRHVHIHAEAVGLLVIQHKMLQAASHTIALGGLDVWHDHLTSQVRVFAHVLKGASVQRGTLDVYTRA